MEKITFLLGNKNNKELSSALEQANNLPAWSPFDKRATSFIAKFSKKLLSHPDIKNYPEVAALAHWFRAAKLKQLEQELHQPLKTVIKGRGLVFHLAPSNVDSVAMYSWLISLLAGNLNWVRVSQKPSTQLSFILKNLQDVLEDKQTDSALAERIVLFTYPHNEQITQQISLAAQCRVVWGGDSTVAAIRAIPLRSSAIELCFPDRFSVAAIKAKHLLTLNEQELAQQAAAFYNDAFWFAQQACSSPRLLAWVGNTKDCQEAQAKFWHAVAEHIKIKNEENTPAMSMSRLGAAFDMAAENNILLKNNIGDFPMRLKLDTSLNNTLKEQHCGYGLFLEQEIEHLDELAIQLSDKEQTLATLGFLQEELIHFIDSLPARAIDRIVPFGQALHFSSVWDGIDLFSIFTRQITIH